MKTNIAIARCSTYEPQEVFASVKRMIDLLGGITVFVKPGTRVLVKPNLLMAKEPQFGITTHPEVVRSVIKILKTINCRILVGDSPSVFGYQIENTDEVYELTGMKRVCEEEEVELVKFDKRRWHGKFPLTRWLDHCDYLVNLPKFKTHQLTVLTGAVKNLFGLIPGTYKTELHKNHFNVYDFSNILVDIYQIAQPDLTIVDGILSLEGDGPATMGKLRQANILLAGKDCVALDSVLALIMGINPKDILTNKEAALRGLGESDISAITVLGERLEDVKIKDFLLPATSSLRHKIISPVIAKIAKWLVKYYPCVERDNCIRCATCISACPNKAISMTKEGIRFNYSRCISCFCCQETCPASAIKIKKSLLAKMAGL